MSLPQGKPLTKALHTVRIVGRLARLWTVLRIEDREPFGPESEGAAFLFALATIGNAAPLDAKLRDECIEACRKAIAEARAEHEQLRRQRFVA